MSASADTIEGIAVAIQATLADQGRPSDLTEGEVAAHQGGLDASRAARQGVSTAKSIFDGQSVPTRGKWKESWDLCDELEDLARKKAPTPALAAGILKPDTVGGFTPARAYKRCKTLIAGLEQFPQDMLLKGRAIAELITTLGEGVIAEDAKAAKKAVLKGAERTQRDAVAALDKLNDDTLMIVRASWGHGSPQVDVLNRMVKEAQDRANPKTEHEQPEEKPV